jgi:hypothetical protein
MATAPTSSASKDDFQPINDELARNAAGADERKNCADIMRADAVKAKADADARFVKAKADAVARFDDAKAANYVNVKADVLTRFDDVMIALEEQIASMQADAVKAG